MTNNNEFANRMATLSACVLASALFFLTTATSAETAPTRTGQDSASTNKAPETSEAMQPGALTAMTPAQDERATAEEEEEFYDIPLQVGDATSNLLAWQRSGQVSSTTPRPIAGIVANRSYERYLKSFDYPIPEKFNSSVKSTSGSSGR